MKPVKTFSANPNDYSAERQLQGLDGWARSAAKLAAASGQAEVAAEMKHIVNVVAKLSDAQDKDSATFVQPTITKGDRFPSPDQLQDLGIKLA